MIDFWKLLDVSSIGDPAKDDYSLSIVNLRSFCLGCLLSENFVLVDPKHLGSEMINCHSSACLRTSIGDNTRQVLLERSFHSAVFEQRDRWMGITRGFTDEAVVFTEIGTRSPNPVEERLHGLDMYLGIVASTNEAHNRFPGFVLGHCRIGQGNGCKLWRKINNRPGCHIMHARLVLLVRSGSSESSVFGKFLIKSLGLGHEKIPSRPPWVEGVFVYL